MKRIVFIAMVLLTGCTNKEVTPPPPETGTLTIYSKSDLGAGNIEVFIDNVSVGIVSHFSPTGVTCGGGDVNIKKAGGNYALTAKGTNGKTWGPVTISIENGTCKSFELTSNATGAGGTTTGSQATVTAPDTQFISDDDRTSSRQGDNWSQSFTINQSTTFVFRFASQYKAQAAIIAPSQLTAFKNMQGFSGFGLFDNVIGTKTVTISAGTYYVAIRNTSSGSNKWSVELDKPISLPASDKASFNDNYFSDTKSNASGAKTWQPFTIQAGFRYFLDGCNVNTDFFIIPASQLTNFQNGGTFNSFTDYNETGGHAPGLIEVKLPPASYYLVSRSSQASSFTYTMERWRVN